MLYSMNRWRIPALIGLLMAGLWMDAVAQRRPRTGSVDPDTAYEAPVFRAMKWRNIGPFRGGRSTAVCGVPQAPLTFFMGTTGGGLWKTTDGGGEWRNISDGYFNTGSVGAVAVAPSDPQVLYVGMGEAPVRGVMTSHGDGVYKSTDGGQTWAHVGLEDTRQISRVRIHPTQPDLVYVAAQGSPYAPTEARGVYRSRDGGESWEQVLFVDAQSGACDLSMDAQNPRILYAAFWDHQRLPWQMRSGGPGSGIWKSVDGGDTWEPLSQGLPEEIMGKIGVAVSPARPQRIWALVEADQGGLYRSDDGGRHWTRINEDRVLRARSWYYMHIYADPQDPDKVVVLNAPFLVSEDGGKSFQQLPTPHGDNHDLWIHPENPQIMINANDGGANVSYNGGKTWSTQMNQPTAQFYRVNADHRFPYYVYGGQQDNSTVAIPSRVSGGGIPNEAFYAVGGCESAFTAFDPDDPRFVYAGCYQGIITRYDQEERSTQDVMAYPFLGLGENAADLPYRFNWNAPILVSEHDPAVIYHAGNQLLRSTDRGQSWQEISPDLTRRDPSRIGWGGGPITNEAAGGENYHTLMYIAESRFDPRTIWTGADDGRMHLTRDGGETWQEVPLPVEEEGMINCIEPDYQQPGKVYVVFNRYKFNDFSPYIYLTEDFGQTWTLKNSGIPGDVPVRVVRADPDREGLLYAGTETGLYVSFDGGDRWSPFQLNLPVVPITDLKVHHQDLIAATQGRAFWILDDLTPLHQARHDITEQPLWLYQPRDAYLWEGMRRDSLPDQGTNPDNGILCYYHLARAADSLELNLAVIDEAGNLLRQFSSQAKSQPLPHQAGMNRWVWNLRMADYEGVSGVMNLGGKTGHKVGPGWYTLRLSLGKDTLYRYAQVLPDPGLGLSKDDYREKQEWLSRLREAVEGLQAGVRQLRAVSTQVEALLDREQMTDSTLRLMGQSLIGEIDSLQAKLIQPRQQTFQDVINFPNQLDGKLIHIQGIIDETVPPLTAGQKKRASDLLALWASYAAVIETLLEDQVPRFNQALRDAEVPFIAPDED